MGAFTFLSQGEIDQPLSDGRLVSALRRARELTGVDFQIVPNKHVYMTGIPRPRNGKLLARKRVVRTWYELYIGCGSGEYEHVIFGRVSDGTGVEWRTYDESVSGTIILNYLEGICDAYQFINRQSHA